MVKITKVIVTKLWYLSNIMSRIKIGTKTLKMHSVLKQIILFLAKIQVN